MEIKFEIFFFSLFLLTSCTSNKVIDSSQSHKLNSMPQDFNFTATQKLQLKEIRKKHWPALDVASRNEKMAKEAFDRCMVDELTTHGDFHKLFSAFKEAQAEKNRLALEFLWDVRDVLNEAQRAKWKQWYDKRNTLSDD